MHAQPERGQCGLVRQNAREFRRRCCEYTLSYLDAKGERVMDVEKRLISGYCKLKDNTDDALRKLDEVTP